MGIMLDMEYWRYYYNRDEYYYKGYVQDARIYQGAAKYTSDFVVPSTFPDILPDTPSGVVVVLNSPRLLMVL